MLLTLNTCFIFLASRTTSTVWPAWRRAVATWQAAGLKPSSMTVTTSWTCTLSSHQCWQWDVWLISMHDNTFGCSMSRIHASNEVKNLLQHFCWQATPHPVVTLDQSTVCIPSRVKTASIPCAAILARAFCLIATLLSQHRRTQSQHRAEVHPQMSPAADRICPRLLSLATAQLYHGPQTQSLHTKHWLMTPRATYYDYSPGLQLLQMLQRVLVVGATQT